MSKLGFLNHLNVMFTDRTALICPENRMSESLSRDSREARIPPPTFGLKGSSWHIHQPNFRLKSVKRNSISCLKVKSNYTKKYGLPQSSILEYSLDFRVQIIISTMFILPSTQLFQHFDPYIKYRVPLPLRLSAGFYILSVLPRRSQFSETPFPPIRTVSVP